ncbi:MAG: 4'-phosphopantetheinyl transferase superfamily protein [Bacteroidales bacterium]|nr:4'-phosphopantetheinyl transferase superfamily protein [Bacteroidales bacterium]MCF8390304.1 4'-phosphopantetheinyl transferase superfamily protein [Bacteroidales bacterium]
MGIILKESVKDVCLMGIWEVSEDYETLLSNLNLDEDELIKLNSFKSEGRKLEWLSVRNLINNLLESNARIIYNADNKPFLKGTTYNISISHSYQLTSIFLSKTKRVGIDLELMSHKISTLSDKFINNQEVITKDPEQRRLHLYIHWCAKEALYKICDKQDINFKENLTIFPFHPKENGIIKGRVLNTRGVEDFWIRYKIYKDYSIVWTCK